MSEPSPTVSPPTRRALSAADSLRSLSSTRPPREQPVKKTYRRKDYFGITTRLKKDENLRIVKLSELVNEERLATMNKKVLLHLHSIATGPFDIRDICILHQHPEELSPHGDAESNASEFPDELQSSRRA